MTAKKIWANFSVKNIDRTSRFYTALGFTPSNQNSAQLASFLFGSDDFVIHFFQQGSQIDNYIASGPRETSEIIFTLSAETEKEVDDWQEGVKNAGGTIFQQAGRDEAGYYGLGFADPDGHRFNILLMEKGM